MASVQAGEVLRVEPGEVPFSVNPNKEVSTTLTLTNLSSQPVAFNVKSNAPQRYISNPSRGVIPGNSQVQISVTMLPQGMIDFSGLKDKFLFQCVVLATQSSSIDISPNTFDKSSGNVIHTAKISVVYLSKEKKTKEEEKSKDINDTVIPSVNSPTTLDDSSQSPDSNLKTEHSKSDLNLVNSDRSVLNIEIESLKSENTNLKHQLKVLSDDFEQSNTEKKLLLEENENLKSQLNSLKDEKADLEKILNDLKIRTDAIKVEIDDKSSRIEELTREKDEFVIQLSSLESDKYEKEKEIQDLKNTIHENEINLLEKDKTIESMNSQNDLDSMKKENAIISNLKSELASLKSQQKFLITQMEEIDQKKSAEIQKLREKILELEQMNNNTDLDKQADTENRIFSLVNEVEDLKTSEKEKDDKIKDLILLIDAKENELRNVNDQLAYLEMQVNYNKSSAEENQSKELLLKELDDLKLSEKDNTQIINDLRASEKDKIQIIDELKAEIKLKSNQINLLNDKLTFMEVDLHMSQLNCQEQEERIKELQDEVEKLKSQSKPDSSESNSKKDLEQKLLFLQNNLTNVLAEAEESRAATDELRSIAERLNENCQSMHSVFDSLKIVDSRHPYHCLKLRSEVEPAAYYRGQKGTFLCSVCKKLGNGYLWQCSAPMCNFAVHTSCPVTTVPPPTKFA